MSGNDIKGNELEILKKDIKVIDIMKKPILFDKLILNLSKAKVINRWMDFSYTKINFIK